MELKMAGAKEIFVCAVIVGLIVQGCFLLMTSSVHKHKNIVNMTNIRAMTNDINHLAIERHQRSNNESEQLIANDVDKQIPQQRVTSTKLLTIDQATVKKTSPNSSTEGRCHYRVQVYDKNGKLSVHKPVLKNVVKRSTGGAVVRTTIPCDNQCTIELTLADEKNKFEGMDAVVFHFMKLLIPKPLPESAHPNQTWIYHSWESPRSNNGEGLKINRLPVHATWTYHRGSEIVTPYGFYRPGVPMTNQTKSPQEWVKGKRKLVAWMASNCVNTYWPRSAFVSELKKLVPVDTYGACGSLKCTPSWSTKCTVDLLRQYKFYLSLENAECGDYITEKLWQKPLMQGVVPIVYGPNRKVYEDLTPPNSFIYVGDYTNMKELADYLKLLDSKPELYAQYLAWQYKGSIGLPKPMHESHEPTIFCNLIPTIEKVKRGELQRVPVGQSKFARACRAPVKGRSVSTYGVRKWDPW
ncbi:alpha-(1,3)-fucosyltransferase 7-like [Asterias amurensis]|uniref:alpha-(1,3)-fucosyltransferase 7-like n=1 Tax=Asterias amurensis TaxID=7602 RepID=UPI003AB371E1